MKSMKNPNDPVGNRTRDIRMNMPKKVIPQCISAYFSSSMATIFILPMNFGNWKILLVRIWYVSTDGELIGSVRSVMVLSLHGRHVSLQVHVVTCSTNRTFQRHCCMLIRQHWYPNCRRCALWPFVTTGIGCESWPVLRCSILITVLLKTEIFWDFTHCLLVHSSRLFEGLQCLHPDLQTEIF
jgi:hypothetical protein